MKRKRLGLLLVGGLMLLGGLMLTLSGCGRAEALDTLYEGEGPTVITYDEAYAMLEEGKTFFFYEGNSFDVVGDSRTSKMMDRVFKKNKVNHYIINRERKSSSEHIDVVFDHPYNHIGLVHDGEIAYGEQNFIAEDGKTREDIERGIDEDVTRLLSLVE